MTRFEEFNPDNYSQEQLNYLADHIENFLKIRIKTMILPKDVEMEHGKEITESIKRTKKLIKELRKGNAPIDFDSE